MKIFETESIDLAAFLAATGHHPTIYRKPEAPRAVFEFPDTASLTEAIVSFERGEAFPAKRLLTVRSSLFREASRVCREGGSK